MVTEHRPTPALLARYRRAYIVGAPIVLAVVLIAVLIGTFGFRQPGDPLWASLVPLVGIVLAFALTLRGTIAKQLRLQGSLNIVMDDVAITRYQASLEPLTIRLGEITRVTESPGRWIRVCGPRSQQHITAPAEMSDYDLLRERIAAVRAPEPYVHGGVKRWLSLVSVFAPIIGMVVVMGSTDRLIFLAGGTLLILYFACCAALIAKSPHMDPRSRRLSWCMVLPVLVLGLKMWSLLWPAS
ncbi:MAG TPA: hypothetical protein VGM86_09130 [Thermoanaerobaculia bacterium]|jgi:hypothetical protein